MALRLAPEEPEAGPWRAGLVTAVVEGLTRLGTYGHTGGRGLMLAVDGRSSSGKTTLAAPAASRAPPGRRLDETRWLL